MSRRDLADRIVEQFSESGERSDAWRAFDLLLPTEQFLNLGHSKRYQTHLLGSPQQRLVERVIDELEAMDGTWSDRRLLDLGCGRGGTAAHLAATYGVAVVGVDLVPYNVALASRQTARLSPRPSFLTGDATNLPFGADAFSTGVAIDTIVYMPDKRGVFEELRRVIEPGGVCVISDLLASPESDETDPALSRFATDWDMPTPWSYDRYLHTIGETDLDVRTVVDLTPNSVGGFKKWTTLFLLVAESPLRGLLDRSLARRGIDPERLVSQVRSAHEALSDLRHVLVSVRA